MNYLSSVIIIYFVLLCSLLIFHLQEVASNSLGESACAYWGAIDKYCQKKPVPINELPKECSSYVFEALSMNLNFSITTKFSEADEEYLQNLLKSGKSTFLFFTHNSQPNWATVLTGDTKANAKKDMDALSTYFKKHIGMTGLIIQDLRYEDSSKPLPGYTDQVKTYIQVLKETFPNLKIGLHFPGKYFIDFYENSSRPEWLDFNILDSVIDFYVFGFVFFNTCTDEFKIGGAAPVDGDAKYTLEKANGFIKSANIPKEKTYFLFALAPKPRPNALGYGIYNFCVRYEQICTNANGSTELCADTEETFRAKGVFSKAYGVGFLGGYIDLDDPDMCCNCGHPYPAFYSILNGWNNIPQKNVCPLFNRK